MLTYEEAGVSIDRGNELVKRIKEKVKRTYNNRVYEGVGGFASLYKINNDKFIAAATDGVGTKLKLAIELNYHQTIGQDLVAMCVNDIICTGATPLFFLDYLATGKIEVNTHESIIDGIVNACEFSEMALIGGETAEMPGIYQQGDYDLAGFCIGEARASELLSPKDIKPGDSLIAIASSGFHSNGYSLLRRLVHTDEIDIKRELLMPTRIYSPLISSLRKQAGDAIHGLAHITGGGIENVKRMNEKLNFKITQLPDYKHSDFKENISPIFEEIANRSKLCENELYKTFNMGMGLVIATDQPEFIKTILSDKNETYFEIGRVED